MIGQGIICVIDFGEREPKVLVQQRNSWIKAKVEDITKALTGIWCDEHLFGIGQVLVMYYDVGRNFNECDAKLQIRWTNLVKCEVNQGIAPRAGSKVHKELDARQVLANWPGVGPHASTAWAWPR